MKAWPFADPENVAVITLRVITDKKAPILLVSHDEDDGMWQFLDGSEVPDPSDALIVSLKEIYLIDPTVGELADLPCGWHAWRGSPDQSWHRSAIEPEETE